MFRLEKAEEEQESYRRRFQLLEVELEKTKKTLAEKQERLEQLEGGWILFLNESRTRTHTHDLKSSHATLTCFS